MRFRTKLTITILILIITFRVGTVFSRRIQVKPGSDRAVRLDKNSKTEAIQVSNIEIRNDIEAVMVTLKNVSNKSVNGIQLWSNKGSVRLEFLDAAEPQGQRLLPGATHLQMFPLTNPAVPFEIAVRAVAFDDKTTDGDPESAKEITESRHGFNKEMKRLKPLLEAALASSEGDSPAIIDKLKSQVDALPVEKDGSFGFRQGQQTARQDFLYDLQVLKERQSATGKVQIRHALTLAKNRYDKRIIDNQ